MSADGPTRLDDFRRWLELPYVMLSDAQLTLADKLSVPISRRHPMARTYPRGAFLQPALFVWLRDTTLAYQWRQTPKLTTLWGARGRPSGQEVLTIVEGVFRQRRM